MPPDKALEQNENLPWCSFSGGSWRLISGGTEVLNLLKPETLLNKNSGEFEIKPRPQQILLISDIKVQGASLSGWRSTPISTPPAGLPMTILTAALAALLVRRTSDSPPAPAFPLSHCQSALRVKSGGARWCRFVVDRCFRS